MTTFAPEQVVAQVRDTVRIEVPGPLYGTFGEVIAQRSDSAPSVTGRICRVLSDGGAKVTIHADYLRVLA